MCVHACVWRSEDNLGCCTLAWNLPVKQGWLPSKCQGCVRFYLPSPGITSYLAQLFDIDSGACINLGPYACATRTLLHLLRSLLTPTVDTVILYLPLMV